MKQKKSVQVKKNGARQRFTSPSAARRWLWQKEGFDPGFTQNPGGDSIFTDTCFGRSESHSLIMAYEIPPAWEFLSCLNKDPPCFIAVLMSEF